MMVQSQTLQALVRGFLGEEALRDDGLLESTQASRTVRKEMLRSIMFMRPLQLSILPASASKKSEQG